MIVAITEMKQMPSSCRQCPLHKINMWEDLECAVIDLPAFENSRRDDCPLCEWKPMYYQEVSNGKV